MGVLVLHPRVYQREETQTALCVCELHVDRQVLYDIIQDPRLNSCINSLSILYVLLRLRLEGRLSVR